MAVCVTLARLLINFIQKSNIDYRKMLFFNDLLVSKASSYEPRRRHKEYARTPARGA